MHTNLKFTHVISPNSVDFLDITIFKGSQFHNNGLFDIIPYQKPMNKYLYIPLFSHHCTNVFKSFIRAEIQRYTRNSTNPQYVKYMCSLLRQRLLARGYPPNYLDTVMNIEYNRYNLLFFNPIMSHAELNTHLNAIFRPSWFLHTYNHKSTATSNLPTLFIIPYTPSYTLHLLRKILKYNNPSEHNILFEPFLNIITNNRNSPIICFKRTKSIGDLLVQSSYNYNIIN